MQGKTKFSEDAISDTDTRMLLIDILATLSGDRQGSVAAVESLSFNEIAKIARMVTEAKSL